MSAHLIFSRNYQQCRTWLEKNWHLNFDSQPDLILLNEDRQGLSIEKIRDFEQILPYPPYKLPIKTIILANFDQVGVPAQNAFLKTLEEHPSYIRFVLQAPGDTQILDTIKSRCLVVNLLGQESDQGSSAAPTTSLAENFLALFPDATFAQLIDWCNNHKEREEAVNFLSDLLSQLHQLNQQSPTPQRLTALTAVNLALSQIKQNFNVLLTLENCLFTIKSRF